MSGTWKDSKQGTVIRVIKRDDGTFDLFLNRELHQGSIHKDGLESALGRFGYCQDEFDTILNELRQNGRAERGF